MFFSNGSIYKILTIHVAGNQENKMIMIEQRPPQVGKVMGRGKSGKALGQMVSKANFLILDSNRLTGCERGHDQRLDRKCRLMLGA